MRAVVVKFKVILGYRGGPEVNLAIERGEVGARGTSWTTTKADWIRDGKIMQVVFSGTEFGRPFAMGMQVPAVRLAAMRGAFEATMKDAEFLAEAAKLKIDVELVAGDYLQVLAEKIAKTPKALTEHAKSLVEG